MEPDDDYVYCICGERIYTTLKGKDAGCYICPIHGHVQIYDKAKFTHHQKKIIERNYIEINHIKKVQKSERNRKKLQR